MYRVIRFNVEEKWINKFISLPKVIYSKKEIMQNEKEELEILKDNHVLSKYFKVYKFIVINKEEEIISRAVLTIYPNKDLAYVGFYESLNIEEASTLLLNNIWEFAKEKGYKKLVGPVDCSFWIKYRLKINYFNEPYTGEPYNKEYYLDLFEKAGYKGIEKYKSNQYLKASKGLQNKRFVERLNSMRKKGYVIKSPTKGEFPEILKEVYRLIVDLYSNFPAYEFIEEEDFIENFSYLLKIIKCNMIKIAYYEDLVVGFFISIPNYKNKIYGKLSLLDYIYIMYVRLFSKEYVMLYMGVDSNHKGLGRAMSELIKEELICNGATSIGALIRDGNINQNYFKEIIKYEYRYMLLEKTISE